MHVTAPASSANLGPGFDCLGLALDLSFELATKSSVTQSPDRYLDVASAHPAFVAFEAAGGDPNLPLVWRSPIPPGRGLGFSGAARVAGGYLGIRLSGQDHEGAVDAAFRLAARLEGHGDNAAASAYGGFCVSGRSSVLRVADPTGLFASLCLVVWSPDSGTSTRSARTKLGPEVLLTSAVRSIAGSATWVAAVVAGRTDLLREACEDLLHQPQRLAVRPDAQSVLETFMGKPEVLAAWLSGSGPSVAALLKIEDARTLTGHMTTLMGRSDGDLAAGAVPAGRIRTLAIADRGVATVQV